MKRIDSDQVGSLLIRGTNWIGDAVMSIPAMREIRRIFPRARISLLVRPWVQDVYSSADFVDEILVFDRDDLHRGWRGYYTLVSSLRRKRFDLAILLQNAFSAALMAWCARIPCRIGYARDGRSLLLTHPVQIDPQVLRTHQAYYYLGILNAVGLRQPCPQSSAALLSAGISIRAEDRASARTLLHSCGIQPDDVIIGINPGAFYGGAKRWLSDRYAAVADALAERHGAKIVIFGSANERTIADQIAAVMKFRPVILAGRTTVGQLMALLKECNLVITNDSGPMHLAAALDVPQLALFGSTNEKATGPLSSQAQVIKHQVECNPCLLRECPIDFRCMNGLTVDRVLNAAEAKLNKA